MLTANQITSTFQFIFFSSFLFYSIFSTPNFYLNCSKRYTHHTDIFEEKKLIIISVTENLFAHASRTFRWISKWEQIKINKMWRRRFVYMRSEFNIDNRNGISMLVVTVPKVINLLSICHRQSLVDAAHKLHLQNRMESNQIQ